MADMTEEWRRWGVVKWGRWGVRSSSHKYQQQATLQTWQTSNAKYFDVFQWPGRSRCSLPPPPLNCLPLLAIYNAHSDPCTMVIMATNVGITVSPLCPHPRSGRATCHIATYIYEWHSRLCAPRCECVGISPLAR